MPKITYVLTDRSERVLDLDAGTTVMRGAVDNDVDGIVGQCGGYAQCGTCHVYVEPDSLGKLDDLGAMSEEEDEMLDYTVCPRTPGSRLSCQLDVGEALDGLVVRLPERQV